MVAILTLALVSEVSRASLHERKTDVKWEIKRQKTKQTTRTTETPGGWAGTTSASVLTSNLKDEHVLQEELECLITVLIMHLAWELGTSRK